MRVSLRFWGKVITLNNCFGGKGGDRDLMGCQGQWAKKGRKPMSCSISSLPSNKFFTSILAADPFFINLHLVYNTSITLIRLN